VEGLITILRERLERKGIEPSMVTGFIRDSANTIDANPHVNHLEVDTQLHLLCWNGFELDYHTLQVVMACFKVEGLKSLENKLYPSVEVNSNNHKGGVNRQSSGSKTALPESDFWG